MTAVSARWWWVLAVAGAAVLVVAFLLRTVPEGDARARETEVPAAVESAGSWRTIEHEGVAVEVPAGWERSDTSRCRFETVRWGRPDSDPCAFEDGLAFYGSALFDPAHRPGVVRTTADGAVTWSGYAYAGDFAVYAFENPDRDVVRHILASARTAG
jgi:hypothetical protein